MAGSGKPTYGPSVSEISPKPSGGTGGGGVLGTNYNPSPIRAPVTIGKTAGISGPTIRGDNYKVSAGVGPRGSIGLGGRLNFKKGGAVKKAKGGSVSSASKRADGCASKGKTKGRFV